MGERGRMQCVLDFGGDMRASRSVLLVIAGGLWLTGCGEPELDGFIWQNTVTGKIDTCHAEGEGTPYQEIMNYRLVFDGSYVELALDQNTFASGTISGCEIQYDSVVWGEIVDGYEVRWLLLGEGIFRQGGSACSIDVGLDWDGEETFEIVYSEHPDLAVGCEYIMSVQGQYLGPVGG